MNAQTSSAEHPKQEPSDLRPRAILLGAAGVITMVLLVALVAYLLTRASGATGGVALTRAPIARATALSSNPEDDITAFQRGKRAQLETYGWADPERRFAHIPIEQAMQKLASQDSSSQGQQ
jgi:hypothetical protein